MVVIRAGIRLIFRHAFGTTEPNGAGFYAILTLEIGQDRLSHGAAERGLRPISILEDTLTFRLTLSKGSGKGLEKETVLNSLRSRSLFYFDLYLNAIRQRLS